jgi:hypothetical protein
MGVDVYGWFHFDLLLNNFIPYIIRNYLLFFKIILKKSIAKLSDIIFALIHIFEVTNSQYELQA